MRRKRVKKKNAAFFLTGTMLWSLLLCCGVLWTKFPQTVAARQTQKTSVTVSTSEQFTQALAKETVTEIIVENRITLSGTAESEDYSISPVMIRGNVTIKGNGSGILTLRSPIQLTGDNVTFQNIEMNFISSGALGSVPHREIFLAGHTLTLDQVNCYTKGSDGSLGGFGGDEEELLPTVYAGGYRKTKVRADGAGLTVKNATDKTMIKAIYAGHDGGKDNKVPYTGTMDMVMDAKTTVREGVFSRENQREVKIAVAGQRINTCRIKSFEGNARTTITFSDVSANRIAVHGGNIVLKNGSIFEPIAKDRAFLDSMEVQEGTVLNLMSMPGTAIHGNFIGGGTLVMDKEDTLTINGAVSGDTTFKTWGGSLMLNGPLTVGRKYIICTTRNVAGTIALDRNYDEKYVLDFHRNTGAWTVKDKTLEENRVFGQFTVLSAPTQIDYAVVEKESLSGDTIEPSQIFVTETRDSNGEVYTPDIFVHVIRKEDVDKPQETDWGTDIWIEELGNWNQNGNFTGKYYLYFGWKADGSGISDKVRAGEYTAYFTLEEMENGTVAEIRNKAVGSTDFTIYKQNPPVPEPPEEIIPPAPQPPEEIVPPSPQPPEEIVPPAPQLPETSGKPEDTGKPENGKTDADKGEPTETFFKIKAKAASGKIRLSWEKEKDADGYLVYGGPAGKKTLPLLYTTTKTQFVHKNVSRRAVCQYYIQAYQLVNGKKVIRTKSPVIHVAMPKFRQTNAKKVVISKKNYKLSPGKKARIKATVVPQEKGKKVLRHKKMLRYYSANENVVKVNDKGWMIAKRKGKAKIYVLANNGVYAAVHVRVK